MDFKDFEKIGPERVEKILPEIPNLRRGLLKKAYAGACSPRQAIKDKCMECVGFEDTSLRVSECMVIRCPLWAFRPFQSTSDLDAPGSGLDDLSDS